MEGTRTSLRQWFQAIRLVAVGINAKQLMARINVTYKTAWLMSHKLRHAMTKADAKTLLTGSVHVQDAIYGGPFSHPSNSPHAHDQPVLAGAEVDEQAQIAYVKMKQVDKSLLKRRYPDRELGEDFVGQHVAMDAQEVFISSRPSKHRYQPLAKLMRQAFRWLSFSFRGIGPKHLQAYLDEFCFRFNTRYAATQLGFLCATTRTITYPQLTKRSFQTRRAPYPIVHPKAKFFRALSPSPKIAN
ncbi:hypothetical protein [Cohnella nanjingensis]|nr:hypothetical protein [Cohnella nanjingensis]